MSWDNKHDMYMYVLGTNQKTNFLYQLNDLYYNRLVPSSYTRSHFYYDIMHGNRHKHVYSICSLVMNNYYIPG